MAEGGREEGELGPLPRGHHGLPRAFVVQHQRERLMAALAEVVAERGYRRTTVADIIRVARVSRRAFYEQFESKESCFLATLRVAIDELCGRMREAAAPEERWELRIRAATAAGVEFLAAEPDLARLLLTESARGGPGSAAVYRPLPPQLEPALPGADRHGPRAGPEQVGAAGAIPILPRALGAGEDPSALVPGGAAFTPTPYLGAEPAEEVAN